MFVLSRIFGYGEDAFTLWASKNRISDVLKQFEDQTDPSKCLCFYRPSFGRSGGEGSAEFGEFDSIVVSSKNIYLIESKWDDLSNFNKTEITLEYEQILRHTLFSWYLTHWNEGYLENWSSFVKEYSDDFQKAFPEKKIAPPNSLLASNLQLVLKKVYEHFGRLPSKPNVKNLILFFYDARKSKPPSKAPEDFTLVSIDYSQEAKDGFISID